MTGRCARMHTANPSSLRGSACRRHLGRWLAPAGMGSGHPGAAGPAVCIAAAMAAAATSSPALPRLPPACTTSAMPWSTPWAGDPVRTPRAAVAGKSSASPFAPHCPRGSRSTRPAASSAARRRRSRPTALYTGHRQQLRGRGHDRPADRGQVRDGAPCEPELREPERDLPHRRADPAEPSLGGWRRRRQLHGAAGASRRPGDRLRHRRHLRHAQLGSPPRPASP